MNKFSALVVARTKEFYRDRSTLIWTFIFPFIVLLGFAYGYSGKSEPLLKVGIYPARALSEQVSGAPQTDHWKVLSDFFSISQIQFIDYDDEKIATQRVERHQLDLLLRSDQKDAANEVHFSVNPESDKASLVERLLTKSVAPDVVFKKEALIGKKLRYADWLVPGLICMNLMFSCLFGVGYVIVRYRKNGVLKRMRATPLSAFEFLAAQVVSRMLLLLITSSITLWGAVLLIGFPMQAGCYFNFLIFTGVGSTALIALGLLVASRISSEEVAEGVLNLMTWPMIFLSGVWFSLDGASPWILKIANWIPLTHVVNGLRAILIDGSSLVPLIPDMLALGGAAVVLIAIGSVIFKWR